MEYLLLLLGLFLLLAGGEYLVKSGADLARRAGVSPLVIGMTVIAMGTSFPELMVSLNAAIEGHPEIALGNAIGSNIANIGLVLAATVLILPLPVQRNAARRDTPFMLACCLMLTGMMADNRLQWYDGLILLLIFSLFMYQSFRRNRAEGNAEAKVESESKPPMPVWTALLVIVASTAALGWGADLLIDNACVLAKSFGVPERVISISLVALGTSLPELVTSLIAASRKETDIAIGNIVGSNIFNIMVVLGIPAIVHPIDHFAFDNFRMDLVWMTGFALLLWLAILPLKQRILRHPRTGEHFSTLGRMSGALMLAGYIVYMILLFQSK